MKMIKYLITGLMVTILTQPVIAETCYDLAQNKKSDGWKYIYNGFQGWELRINGGASADTQLYYDEVRFKKVKYFPNDGLYCEYEGYDYLPSYKFTVRTLAGRILLIKKGRYDVSNWNMVSNVYQCENNDVQQCIFEQSPDRLIIFTDGTFKK